LSGKSSQRATILGDSTAGWGGRAGKSSRRAKIRTHSVHGWAGFTSSGEDFGAGTSFELTRRIPPATTSFPSRSICNRGRELEYS
jgi:hypothetical protein